MFLNVKSPPPSGPGRASTSKPQTRLVLTVRHVAKVALDHRKELLAEHRIEPFGCLVFELHERTRLQGGAVLLPRSRQQPVQHFLTEVLDARVEITGDAPAGTIPNQVGLVLVAVPSHHSPPALVGSAFGRGPCSGGLAIVCGCVRNRSGTNIGHASAPVQIPDEWTQWHSVRAVAPGAARE